MLKDINDAQSQGKKTMTRRGDEILTTTTF
jgi:hypothetical protein